MLLLYMHGVVDCVSSRQRSERINYFAIMLYIAKLLLQYSTYCVCLSAALTPRRCCTAVAILSVRVSVCHIRAFVPK